MTAVPIHWSNAPSLQLLADRVAGRVRRQFLVFVIPRRDMPSPFAGLSSRDRNFDLAVRFYDDPGQNSALADDAEYVMTGGLSKFHSAYHFLKACGLEDKYDGYLFLDGDLEFDAGVLSAFLSLVHAIGLDLAQPSLTRDSYGYWGLTYHQPAYVFRRSSFVEVMAPYFSRRALQVSLPTFTRSISTYGLDLVWPSLVGESAIGIIDAFQMRHKERVDHASGNFYKYLKSIGVDLDQETHQVMAEYGVTRTRVCSRRGYFWKQPSAHHGQDRMLVSVPLYGIEAFSNRQGIIDATMRFARRGPAQAEPDLARRIAPYFAGQSLASPAAPLRRDGAA